MNMIQKPQVIWKLEKEGIIKVENELGKKEKD